MPEYSSEVQESGVIDRANYRPFQIRFVYFGRFLDLAVELCGSEKYTSCYIGYVYCYWQIRAFTLLP